MASYLGLRDSILPDLSFLKKEEEYFEEIEEILHCFKGITGARSGPARLLEHLYLGNMADAEDPKLLKRLKITHVLNCAGWDQYGGDCVENRYEANTGVTDYLEIPAKDDPTYPMLYHYEKSKKFIDSAASNGCKVLVHCELGINRSGAICVAYMMEHENKTLLDALKDAKQKRPVILTNQGFVKQLYFFAKERGLLYKN